MLGPEDYGTFGVMLALMTTVNLILISGFPQACSKYIAEDNARLSDIVRYSRIIQVIISLVVFGIYLGLASVIADLLGDSELTPYIRISALCIPAYALFGLYEAGYLNGLRQFGKQAKASLGNSLSKVAIVFLLVFLGLGVTGAIIGYILAALVGFFVAWKYLGKPEEIHSGFDWHKLVRFGIPATLFAVIMFTLLSIDLWAVKALTVSDKDTGYYTSANTIARVPFFVFQGLVQALLPSISRSTSRDDSKRTRDYINRSMRYVLMLLIPGILLLSATSSDLIALAYGSEYQQGAAPLELLVLGVGLLTVFSVLTSATMGAGRTGIVLAIAMVMAVMDIALNVILIPEYGLMGAATATTITSAAGMLAICVYVRWYFGTLVRFKSVMRFCLAALPICSLLLIPLPSPLLLPLAYAGYAVLYIGILWVAKELQSEDIKTVKRLFSRGNSDETEDE